MHKCCGSSFADAASLPDRKGYALPSGMFSTRFTLGYYAVAHYVHGSRVSKGFCGLLN
jgi:hypothetical protein